MFERTLPTSTKGLQALASSLIAELARKDELLATRDHQIGRHEQQIAQHVQSIEERDRALAASLQELNEANALAEKLKFELARYRRWRFGKKSEALSADQIALWEAELDADIEAIEQRLENLQQKLGAETPAPKRTPKRQALPATLPRLEEILEPESTTCCGATMTRIGEDVAETLEMIPSRFWVRRRIRGKWACRCCERIAMAPVQSAPIDKAIAGASVLANVVVSKFVDHLPLHRQEAIYTRMGVAIPRSTMAGWLGRIGVSVQPLVELLAEHVIATGALQADETSMPVLDPGSGKTATGYLWAYRTLPSDCVQAVVFDFAASRSRVHPNQMLAGFAGTLQVDGYAGYNEILRKKTVTEAGCWAHARRKFVDVFEATKSPVAREAIRRIADLYKIEHEIDDLGEVTTLERGRWRQSRAGPLLEELHAWLVAIHAKSPPRGSLAKAIQYTLNRWAALTQFVQDGRLPLDTNAVENAIRPIALGRRNWLFAGSEAGGVRAAQIYSLLGSARLAGLAPLDYITDVLQRMPTARMRDLEAMLPWNWKPSTTRDIEAELCAPPLPLILVSN